MTEERQPSRDEMEKLVMEATLRTRVEEYEDAIGVFEKYLPKLSSGSDEDKIVAAAAFSYYGLCIAVLHKRYSDAFKFCRVSIRVQRLNVEHYENLGKIHLLARNRKGAVEALYNGLQYEQNHKSINKILDRIGCRREPIFTFLPRDNFINIYLGKIRHRRFERRREAAMMKRGQVTVGTGKLSAADNRIMKAQARAIYQRDKNSYDGS